MSEPQTATAAVEPTGPGAPTAPTAPMAALAPKPPEESIEALRLKSERALTRFEDPFSSVAGFRHFMEIAKIFAASSFVPQAFHGKPGDCLIGINIAMRMKEDPLMVIQQMFTVKGTPGFKTQFMIGRCNRQGGFKSKIRWEIQYIGDLRAAEAEEEALAAGKSAEQVKTAGAAARAANPRRIKVETTWSEKGEKKKVSFEMPNIRVTARAVDGFGEEVDAWVDTQTAIDEDWISNPKYKSMPEHMLKFRSAAFLIREYAPEVLMGMPLVEELETMKDVTPRGEEGEGLTRAESLFNRLSGSGAQPNGGVGGEDGSGVIDLTADADGAQEDGGGSSAPAKLSPAHLTELRALAGAAGVSVDALEEEMGVPLTEVVGPTAEDAFDAVKAEIAAFAAKQAPQAGLFGKGGKKGEKGT